MASNLQLFSEGRLLINDDFLVGSCVNPTGPDFRVYCYTDKVSGPKTHFFVFNFFCIDFRRERCDPESRGSVDSDRPLLGAKPLHI